MSILVDVMKKLTDADHRMAKDAFLSTFDYGIVREFEGAAGRSHLINPSLEGKVFTPKPITEHNVPTEAEVLLAVLEEKDAEQDRKDAEKVAQKGGKDGEMPKWWGKRYKDAKHANMGAPYDDQEEPEEEMDADHAEKVSEAANTDVGDQVYHCQTPECMLEGRLLMVPNFAFRGQRGQTLEEADFRCQACHHPMLHVRKASEDDRRTLRRTHIDPLQQDNFLGFDD